MHAGAMMSQIKSQFFGFRLTYHLGRLIFLITNCLAQIFTNIYRVRVLGVEELVYILITEHSNSGQAHGIAIPLQIKTKSKLAAF